jgi:hypothetical protein
MRAPTQSQAENPKTPPREQSVAEQAVEILVLARRAGATTRTLARLVGVSKSTMGRWLPAIDAEVSRLGQEGAKSPEISESACPIWDAPPDLAVDDDLPARRAAS